MVVALRGAGGEAVILLHNCCSLSAATGGGEGSVTDGYTRQNTGTREIGMRYYAFLALADTRLGDRV